MRPVLFKLGGVSVYSFGTFIALGVIVAGLVVYWALKRARLKTGFLFDAILYSLLVALVGARLVYYFAYQNQFHSFWQLFYFWQGGLVAIGGLVSGFLAYLYYIRQARLPVWPLLDAGSLGLLIGWAIGKIGCHLSGCSLGRLTNLGLNLNGTIPVDLLSSFWSGLLFVIFAFWWVRQRLTEGVVFFLAIESLLLGELLIKTMRLDFGTDPVRLEAVIYLGLIVLIYLVFWRLHGPRISRDRLVGWVGRFRSRRN